MCAYVLMAGFVVVMVLMCIPNLIRCPFCKSKRCNCSEGYDSLDLEGSKRVAIIPETLDLTRLPEPDPSGIYWFKDGSKSLEEGSTPCIMPIQSTGYPEGSYLLSLGRKGILFEGIRFRIFPSPHTALVEMRKRLTRE